MKNIFSYIALISLLALIHIQASSQVCPDKYIKTNPENPVNSDTGPSKKLNNFNWLAEKYDINSAYIASPQVFSPFHQDDNSIVSDFFENKDMRPEDGWEILKYDVGKTEDGANATPPADFIYLVLYNKLRGTLRVFVAGDRPTPFNGARIRIKLIGEGVDPYMPSIMSHSSELKAVEAFTEEDQNTLAVSEYKNGLAKWFYGDFNTAYDPCVCLYESRLEIQITLIDKSLLTLSGEIEGEISNIDDKVNAGDPTENGWSFTAKDLQTVAKNATKSYSTINKFTSQQQ